MFMIICSQRYCEHAETVSEFTDKSETNEEAAASIADGIGIYEIGEAAQFCARATSIDPT